MTNLTKEYKAVNGDYYTLLKKFLEYKEILRKTILSVYKSKYLWVLLYRGERIRY